MSEDGVTIGDWSQNRRRALVLVFGMVSIAAIIWSYIANQPLLGMVFAVGAAAAALALDHMSGGALLSS